MEEQLQLNKISDDPHLQVKIQKNQQNDIDISFEENLYQSYFIQAQLKRSKKSWYIADNQYKSQVIRMITQQIIQGFIQLKQPSQNIDQYLNILQQKTLKQQRSDHKTQNKKQLLFQLKYLNLQISDNRQQCYPQFQNSNIKMRVFTKQEHKQFIQKFMHEKEQKEKHKKQKLQKEQKIRAQTQEKERELSLKIQQDKRQRRRKQILKSLQKKKQLRQQILIQKQENDRKYAQIKKRKCLYQQVKEKYETNILVPMIQNKKKKLKQIRQMRKNLNFESIINHQKQYLKKKQQQKQTVKQFINNNNYRPPQKAQKLKILLQQQKLEKKKQLFIKKRQAQQKLQRQHNFSSYIKQKFVPKIDHFKRFQLQQKMNNFTKSRQITVNSKQLGNQYLQIAKKRKKKIKTMIDQRQLSNRLIKSQVSVNLKQKDQKLHSNRTDYLLDKKKNSHQLKRKRIQKLINSQEKSIQKIQKLQLQSDQLHQTFKRKEKELKLKLRDPQIESDAIQILLNDIRAKIGIISTYNKQICFTQQ